MKTVLLISMCLCGATSALSGELLRDYDWKQLAEIGQLEGGIITEVDGKQAVKVINTNTTPLRVSVLKIEKPAITRNYYALEGQVKYEQVHGDAYLEMWSVFPPAKTGDAEGRYFSRTMGESGPMGKLTGTSDWRALQLPFNRTGASNSPIRLELNIYLPGQGTVYVGPLKLVEYSGGFTATKRNANAWWSDRTAGWIGGIGGTVFGCLAALLTWLAQSGRARSFVVFTSAALIGIGVLALISGLVALSIAQPYEVWFPLVLIGVLLVGILSYRLKQFIQQYSAIELRRMSSIDALG
jgi:hypothetical protein